MATITAASQSSSSSSLSSSTASYIPSTSSSTTSLVPQHTCGYHQPKSGFNRIKCYCPSVYKDHLQQSNQQNQQPKCAIMKTEEDWIWMMEPSKSMNNHQNHNQKQNQNQDQKQSQKQKIKSSKYYSSIYQKFCYNFFDIEQSIVDGSSSGSSYYYFTKLFGSFLIGILFLSLVVMAVFIRVEIKNLQPTAAAASNVPAASSLATITTTTTNNQNNLAYNNQMINSLEKSLPSFSVSSTSVSVSSPEIETSAINVLLSEHEQGDNQHQQQIPDNRIIANRTSKYVPMFPVINHNNQTNSTF